MRCTAVKRALVFVIMTVCLCLGGCASWMDGQYHSVTPHEEQNLRPEQETVLVSSYIELRQAMQEMVETGVASGIISFTGMETKMVGYYMNLAINYVCNDSPIGAYAVDKIDYEIGTNSGRTAAAVEISYNHNRSEILRIKQTKTMDEAVDVIKAALDSCDAGVTVRTAQYETLDFVQMIRDYADENPDKVMEVPQVTVSVYPDGGADRVVDLVFTYQSSRDTLRAMQKIVDPIFRSAKLYVTEDAQVWEKYSQLYTFLMERHQYTVETSLTPSYSLLRHGVGDSRAFAAVYAAMCRQIGLDCTMVSGTKGGEPRCWNVIFFEGVYYHIDLLQCNVSGGFRISQESDMAGYVWDYSAFSTGQSDDS